MVSLGFNQASELALAADADVEVAVGGQDHSIDAAWNERTLRQRVGELDPLATVRRATGLEACES